MDSTLLALATIFSTLLSPIIALRLQRLFDKHAEKERRKNWIFSTLLATRGDRVGHEHSRALNMIDLEFHGQTQAERAIRAAWKAYLDKLSEPVAFNPTPEMAKMILDKRNELFVELLSKMAVSLGYSFDNVELLKGGYAPQSFFENANQNAALRNLAIELLEGKRPLVVQAVQSK